eukprot:TRINITY_DN5113_c0_g1_i1.p1 TRINITY_DN5113_c0_g1~~TRINITY_DN5113_c0_g1_i1.p1  ORF type:complete len:360 (+),score=70.37 TRINITY_DN5113_c0_g1_i1:23-1102(+)
MSTQKAIGILTGGGDCPGLNAVIRAVCMCLGENGYKIYGIKDGFEGLYRKDVIHLDCEHYEGILHIGGTILGTTNRGSFGHPIAEEVIQTTLKNYQDLGLECIVVIGGDGSQSIAYALSQYGLHFVGVPKTIDNDLRLTDVTFGFDSAVTVVTDALDRLHTTACSHHRVMVVEVMGRNAGWIALEGGIAGAANIILLPEIDWTWESLIQYINKRHQERNQYTIIVVSEGCTLPSGSQVVAGVDHKRNESKILGGVGQIISNKISTETDIETRQVVLGHIQRGGSPSSYDRILSTKFGGVAAELVLAHEYEKLVSLKGTEVVGLDIHDDIGNQKLIDPETDQLLKIAKMMGIHFADDFNF